MTRILLADDHPLYAEALATLIQRAIPEAEIILAADLEAAHITLAAQSCALVIIDLNMPGMSGLNGIESTLVLLGDTPLVLISGAASQADVTAAIQLGVKGFIPKTLPSAAMIAVLHVVLAGGTYVPTDYAITGTSPSAENMPQTANTLTPREASVMTMLAAGRSNKEIARALELQEITVKLHVRNIFRKLGVHNRVEAANAFGRPATLPLPVP